MMLTTFSLPTLTIQARGNELVETFIQSSWLCNLPTDFSSLSQIRIQVSSILGTPRSEKRSLRSLAWLSSCEVARISKFNVTETQESFAKLVGWVGRSLVDRVDGKSVWLPITNGRPD